MGNKKRNQIEINTQLRKLFVVVLVIICLISVWIRISTFGNNPSTIITTEAPVNTPENISSENSDEFTSDLLEVYFFDAGQADSILLRTSDKVMLVDTGNAGDADNSTKLSNKINLSHELDRLGIKTIDYLVATHPHEDHMGSMYKIINLFDVKNLYSNKILPENEWAGYYKRFVEALENSNTHLITPTIYSDEELKKKVEQYNVSITTDDEKIIFNPDDYFRVGDTIPFGNAIVTILGPNGDAYRDTNDYSIVLMVEFEGVKLILTGDAGTLAEREILLNSVRNNFDLKSDILKVGHHGSRTASSEDFISTIKPTYSIIMVGEDNSYGLPDEDVIERLEKYGSTIYMTKDVGDIKLTINDGKYDFDLDFSHEEKEAK